jgi:methanogenic corrinoid protein MtbC1
MSNVGAQMTAEQLDRPHAPGHLSLEEVARELGVHYMTAYRYVRTGLLAARQQNGRWCIDAVDLDAFRGRKDTPRGRARGAIAIASGDEVARLADRLEQGDEPGAWRILGDVPDRPDRGGAAGPLVLSEALAVIGDRWQAGRTSVGEEHRATVVAMRLLGRLGARNTRPGRTRGTVVLAAAPGDRHGLPTAIAAEVLRSRGFAVVDLGADVPPGEAVAVAVAADRLVAVGFCATNELRGRARDQLRRAIDEVRRGVGCPVSVGGAAVRSDAQATRLGADHRTVTATDLADHVSAVREASAAMAVGSR